MKILDSVRALLCDNSRKDGRHSYLPRRQDVSTQRHGGAPTAVTEPRAPSQPQPPTQMEDLWPKLRREGATALLWPRCWRPTGSGPYWAYPPPALRALAPRSSQEARPRATCQAHESSLSPAYVPCQVLNSSGNKQGLTQFQNDLSKQAKGSKNKAASFVQHLQNTSGSSYVWKRIGRPGTGTQREKAGGPPC